MRRLLGDTKETPVEVDSKDKTFPVAAVSKFFPVMYRWEPKNSSKVTIQFLQYKDSVFSYNKQINTLITSFSLPILLITSRCVFKIIPDEWR